MPKVSYPLYKKTNVAFSSYNNVAFRKLLAYLIIVYHGLYFERVSKAAVRPEVTFIKTYKI